MTEALNIDRRPELREPIAIAAFAGWNDAASAATNAARFVVRRLGARRFASIDPETFFDFTQTRPVVRVDSKGNRPIEWPANDFFYARNPAGPHDLVLFIGAEPSLRWKQFTKMHADVYRQLGVELVVSLGALMADVPHTRDVRVTGSAQDPALGSRLHLSPSRYEGPTGIVGVLHEALRAEGLPAASLWANVPHYITTSQNPPATLALLKRLQPITGLEFDFTELQAAGGRFVTEVETAIQDNPEIVDYVHKLEQAIDDGRFEEEAAENLPAPGDLVLDVEEFLRGQRDEGSTG